MLTIRLFGKFLLQQGDAEIEAVRFGKLAELFCVLLLRRDRCHSREILASMLWGESTTAQSKKYLRHALWQLQSLLRNGTAQVSLLAADRDSVRVEVSGDVWLDVALFEAVCAQVHNVHHSELTEGQAQSLKTAIELYRGDLLEGWYHEWCLIERERMQNLYLVLLEKLMRYSEEHRQYAYGMEAGERILRLDPAHEPTHESMMRMQYAAGNRAAAVRQYQRCESALREELGVRPAHRTEELLRTIRADSMQEFSISTEPCPQPEAMGTDTIQGLLAGLRRLLNILTETQCRIEHEVEAITREMTSRKTMS